MRTLATKQPSNQDSAHQKPVRATPVPVARSLSTGLAGSAMLQRKPGCACGGGCPLCQEQALLQTKLKISEPGDVYEQEADLIADQVMQIPEPRIQRRDFLNTFSTIGQTNYRFDTFIITERDLSDAEIIARLKALPRNQLIEYRDRVADVAVKEYINNLLANQTSLEIALSIDLGSPPFVYKIGPLTVTVKQDTTDSTLIDAAKTKYKLPGKIKWKSKGGKIASFKYKHEVWIQTNYRPDTSPAAASGYGRGRTEEDIKADRTSLGFHEGSHVLDILQYLREHPVPRFTGKVSMPLTDFKRLANNHKSLIKLYETEMEKYLIEKGDCVGIKADFCPESVP
jgi:hypothetical protein